MVTNVIEEVKCQRLASMLEKELLPDVNNYISISMIEAFNVVLLGSVLEMIRANVNRVFSARRKEVVTLEEFRVVIILHVLATSYGSPVSTITAKENAEFFYQIAITGERYMDVWTALFCTREKRHRVEFSNTGWCNKPTRGNSLITELEQEFAAVNRSLLYSAGATILSLDDDHQRLSSRAVTQLKQLRQVNSPQKAPGLVNNALYAALNPVFLASHYSRPGEPQIHIWKRLVQLIQGVPTIGAITPMTDSIFAADRGYNSKDTILFVNERLCATGIGTHKRSLDYPFVFGDGPVRKKHKGMVVSEKGCRALYSAPPKSRSSNWREIESAVYREGFSGGIAAVYYNNKTFLTPTGLRWFRRAGSMES